MPTTKTKYVGEFNVSGEVTELYVHAFSRCDAQVLFGRQLSELYGRKIFVDKIDHTIKEVKGCVKYLKQS